MDEESYRHELRNHFMGQMKNSKLQSSTQYYKDQAMRTQQKLQDYDISSSYPSATPQARNKQQPLAAQRNNGGDADRMLYEATNYSGDSYRRNSNNGESNYMRQMHTKLNNNSNSNKTTPIMTTASAVTATHKYRSEDTNTYDIYETDSNMGGGGPGSEESGKSQKSSKTVVSKKSSHDLRKMVKSQCKLHEVIDETLKQMCSTEGEATTISDEMVRIKDVVPPSQPLATRQCKRCCEKLVPQRSSQKDVMTEIGKGDFLDCRSGDTLTISVDDVVNSKVINPMIRKLQRMYLNNLKEEMSLMEDLERLPHKVNEVYKATIFKQKE